MNKIIKILMERDGLSQDEAKEQVEEFFSRLQDESQDPFELEEEFTSEFGLEPDYFLEVAMEVW